jgi:PEGA domain
LGRHTTSRPTILLAIGATCGLALAMMLLPNSAAQQSRGPFSEVELIRALQGDIPPKRIEALARQYGISFELTSQAEAELRQAGATDELLQALRELYRPPPPPPSAGPVTLKSTPAEAQVYLDGKLVGTTNAEGELQLLQVAPGTHNVRLARAGYEDYEETLMLTAGQAARIPVSLKASKPIVAAHAPPPAAVATFRVTHVHTIGSCDGDLIIGHAKLEYRADHNGSHSFESPLSDIIYGSSKIGGGFYLKTKDGKTWDFHSKSTLAILQILEYPENYK